MPRKPPDSGKLRLVGKVDKSAENVDKSRTNTRRTMPGRNGGTLLIGGGRGPAPGAPNAGRPPDAWKAKMRELADRWAQAAEIEKVLDNPTHEHWMAAGKTVIEQAHGAPSKRVELAGDPEQPLTVRIVREA